MELSRFDPLEHLEKLLRPIGLSINDTGGKISIVGEDPILPSVVRLGTAFSLSAMAAAVGAAAVWRKRTGEGQDLYIDISQAAHGINPDVTFHPTINGYPYPNWMGMTHPFGVFPYKTKDGRWVYPSAVYPHQQTAWLNFFNCGPEHRRIAASIANWNAQELEDTANSQGLTVCMARTPEEWLNHPQGQYLSHEPVIAIRKIGDSDPEAFEQSERPLGNVNVLAATHAIAGPVVGRTLAEQGAQVLQFNHPDDFEHDWVYDDANVGERSTYLNLKNPKDNDTAKKLVQNADIFVNSYRGRKIARFGFSPEELARIRPGIIAVSVRCYGYDGPWAERGGFDMLGSAASGLAMLEGKNGMPALPPLGMLNDYITGYMGAAGATAALLKREKDGGSYHVTVSLTRNAMWYQSLGLIPEEDLAFASNPLQRVWESSPDEMMKSASSLGERLSKPEVIIRGTPLGEVRRLAPAVTYSATPAYWSDPILVPRGSGKPEWIRS
ncbi:MAG TPA: CoA transferase [Candidatus Bathyarchaeia archaeon]|nr:CoA transferase [Candidatus Bathyarchaeia archaeon]